MLTLTDFDLNLGLTLVLTGIQVEGSSAGIVKIFGIRVCAALVMFGSSACQVRLPQMWVSAAGHPSSLEKL